MQIVWNKIQSCSFLIDRGGKIKIEIWTHGESKMPKGSEPLDHLYILFIPYFVLICKVHAPPPAPPPPPQQQ